jgi:DNA-binding response OmpR family regulator
MRILLVDDDEAFRLALEEVLSVQPSYDVVCVDGGESALDLLGCEHFDVVVLDYNMHGLSGLNVLQRMHEQKMETPVIMLTAAGTETVAVEAMKLGAYDYIRKEHIDVDHLPVIINGVYERFLFRKEKERWQREVRQRELSVGSVQTLQNTISALGELVNNSLAVLSLSIDEHEQELLSCVSKEDSAKVNVAFMDLRQLYSVVSSGVRSLINLSGAACQRSLQWGTDLNGSGAGEMVTKLHEQVSTAREQK